MDEKINSLYGKIYRYNQSLLNATCNLDSAYSCPEVIDFYITSHAMSFIRNLEFRLIQSHGFIFNARCIIEGIAVKRFCQASSVDVKLLKKQKSLLEYRYYTQLKSIIEYILIPEKLKTDYLEAVNFYKDKLKADYSSSKINEIIKSPIPFLCNPHLSYRKIVAEQLGEDFAKVYGILSQTIHPSLNDAYSNIDELKIPFYVIQLIESEYDSLRKGQHNLDFHCKVALSGPIPKELRSLSYDESDILIHVADMIEKLFEKNYISDTLKTLYLLVNEMMLDTLMGLREQTKSKQKLFLDLVSVFYEIQMKEYPDKQMKLLCQHAEIQRARNLGAEYNIDKAYKTYLSIYPNGIDKQIFDEKFITMTGYLIDQDGNVKSLTKAVKDYLCRFDNQEDRLKISQINMLDYLESQLLSHANGYLFFANTGAWSEVNNLLIWTDIIIADTLQSILSIYKNACVEDNKKKYKPLINAIRNGIKEIQVISNKKIELLNLPAQNLNSVM